MSNATLHFAASVLATFVANASGGSEAAPIELRFEDIPKVRLAENQQLDQLTFPAAALINRELRLVGFAEGDRAVSTVTGTDAPLASVDPDAVDHLFAGASAAQLAAIKNELSHREHTLVFLELAGTPCPPCERERAALAKQSTLPVLIVRRLVPSSMNRPAGVPVPADAPNGFRVAIPAKEQNPTEETP